MHSTGSARIPRRHLTLALLLLTAWALGGCAGPDQPRKRIGALPFPGLFTLFEAADPADLGSHYYGNEAPLFNDEQSGILYTCRAGFLDLVHIRHTLDHARYYHMRLTDALRKSDGQLHLVLRSPDPSHLHVSLMLPREWQPRPPRLLAPETEDALVELSLQLAWIATTWHEIITWFGYKSAVIIPEHQSAFTYDDTMSHVVGLMAAEPILRRGVLDTALYNLIAAEMIDAVLAELHVVTPEEMEHAIRLVEGWWWENGRSLKRYVDIGLEGNAIEPWLVPGFDRCGDHSPKAFHVPPLLDALGPGGRPIAFIEIDPRILEAGDIRAAIPGSPQRIIPHRDFPYLMQRIRSDFKRLYGSAFDQPYATHDAIALE